MEITNVSAGSQAATSETPAAQGNTALANKETFLQLLVAQIKNQDPLQPMDGVQFLSQLAQFSELEQLIGIRQQLTGLQAEAPAQPQGSI
jgi:flagellar basal-body rod modification protein FlgD